VLACSFATACAEDEPEQPPGPSVSEAGVIVAPGAGGDSGAMNPASDAAVRPISDGGPGQSGDGRDAAANPAQSRDAGRTDAASPQQDASSARPDAATDAGNSTRPDATSGALDSGGTGQAEGGTGLPEAGSGNPAYPPITNGCPGYATRYWDCCKPHCGWSANTAGATPLTSCNQSDAPHSGNYNVQSACPSGGAFMCQSNAPWAVSSRLAYGFAAVSSRGDVCGKCYQLQFTGSSRNAGNDPGSAALNGKTMIVQATNVGGDVGSGQFDLLVPGGGVGMFNACSTQWGVATSELGAQYGGFLATCKKDLGAGNHAALKSCVMQRCNSVFGARGLTKLEAGCRWFVEWFEAADNPALQYKEIACPQELKSRGINRSASPGNGCSI
jgi:hypothetical protein